MICHLHPYTIKHLHDAECVKYLGSGSFGDVRLYKCKEKVNGCTCNKTFVVKHIKINKFKRDEAYVKKLRKNLLNEYTIGTLLHHPCIRETLDIDLEDNSIIFEYCPGIDFFNLLKYNCLNPKDEIEYFKQLIDGVSYMHNIGIAHMDLKLENILVDYTNKKIKIIDFGEASVFHDSLHISTIIPNRGLHGSLPYIAPEEFDDKEYNPEKVDVWACGIILYEIIYHSFPWRQANMKDPIYKKYLYNKSNNDFIMSLPHYPSRKLIMSMLNPNSNDRCRIKEIKEDLNNLNNIETC
jgi:protein-serine/threonine kinase